ncbi:MAG: phosphate acetyltransferase [Desulfosarcina sp.]|nr:phosphate acetyltransferase [Desulfosarcina sp.]MBC2742170.1 phosphate acetyltransferase [Desulfosarcina sp.]MBC2765082.1 phosphate acetyltransferase [Desulfosarcina sp.]
MSNNLYIAATGARSGKSAISLGVMEMLLGTIDHVGFFRPIIEIDPKINDGKDNDIYLMSSHFNLKTPHEKMYGYTAAEAKRLLSLGKEAELIEGILQKYSQMIATYDFVLCEGTDFTSSISASEFDLNAMIAKNLNCPVLLVVNAHKKSMDDTLGSIEFALDALSEKKCDIFATIVNRADPKDGEKIINLLKGRDLTGDQGYYTMPNEESLGSPTVAEIDKMLEAKVLYGEEQLNRHVLNFTVAAMHIRHFFDQIEHGSLVITSGDRADVIVACLAAVSSMSIDNIAGMVLTGGLVPEEPIDKLIKGFSRMVPILSVKEDTFSTARKLDRIHPRITPDNGRKISRALAVFEKNVNLSELGQRVITTKTTVVTPKMFEFGLLQKARAHKQHIVLPEGEEERILRAAETLLRREVVDITLLGDEQLIQERIVQLDLNLSGAKIIDPLKSELFEEYVAAYYNLRQHKGITMENAKDIMSDVSYFGTMMTYKGDADGMVSGALHTTGATIRPAFEIIKTKPGFSIVSSVFLMCLPERVLVYGDCAVNPNPNAKQLAQIAISSAQTAITFGIDPRVAMLSYSTGESGTGEDVNRVREATQIAKETNPDLKLEGPIQYDAAVDLAVAKTKMPDSEVAGKATVLIFPDLNTGNNTYKAVQRSAGAVAIGPILQGLNHPVNDLSRGCTIPDIVNTVAITAIQAQTEKNL